ncbi:MAG: hypothetical protein KAU31_03930, partial [Spirochaetaceae bacterium]|nr:hypothetical protein [Spirochaetaceae bacterium]
GGEPVGDVAVYLSDHSKVSVSDNGDALSDASARANVPEHIRAAAGAVAALESRHYSVDVITRMNPAALDAARVLIVPDARHLGNEETNAIREFVAGGGNLYASGSTSLGSHGGSDSDDDSGDERFALEDLLGCAYERNESAGVAYVVPKQARLVAAIAPSRMATRGREYDRGDTLPIVQAGEDSDVLATFSFPSGHPGMESAGPGQWSSIHSDPPWHHTSLPAVVRHQCGKGTVIYSSCDLESQPAGSAGSRLFGALIDMLREGPCLVEIDAPPWVSVCLFHQADRNRYVVTLLAYPRDLPVQPVEAVECRLRLPVSRVLTVTLRETGESLKFTHKPGGPLALTIPVIDKLAVLIVDYSTSS